MPGAIRMTRPTDPDVDAMSRIYQASWKGATFNWEGANGGYIVRVTPKGTDSYEVEMMLDRDTVAYIVRALKGRV